ncbi:hypothetical protein O9X98_10190 [Agrobacterium salinitolerans]|nr:hypothetical protein [Agrobacterium salinitolerans]
MIVEHLLPVSVLLVMTEENAPDPDYGKSSGLVVIGQAEQGFGNAELDEIVA